MKKLVILFSLIAFFGEVFAQKDVVISEKKMVTIPAGIYKPFFVSKSNQPMKIAAFLLDETAVTNVEFLEFVKANPQWRRSKVNRLFADTNYLKHWESDLSIGKKNQKIYNSPVVHVSWFAAQAYSKWKNKRLPTVAEWERAALGNPVNVKYATLTDYILNWYRRPNLPILPNIKSTYKNQYGLYDMHGLVWEWTFNFNSFISSGDSRGNAEELKAFCAAGSINVADQTDYASYLRFSYRGSLKGNFCIANLGFRCAKDIKK
ncbi:MAG: formylglycine-generating enzyme family protein [Ginsengibacter sp.]|jgi:formylglycine-generating enzyme required for sulfatase activity